MHMETLFVILLAIFVLLLVVSDYLTIKQILRQQRETSKRVAYILLVLLLPVIGISIYYFIKK